MPIPSLFIGGQAISSQQHAITVTSNNIANVNTTAFKRSTTTFQDALGISLGQPSSPTLSRGGKNPIETGAGVIVSGTSTEFTQGSIKRTGIATDFAVSDNGPSSFFVLSGASGGTASSGGGKIQNPVYTRDGHFSFDSEGNLVNADGLKVFGITYYDPVTEEMKSVSNYSSVTYHTDQAIGPKGSPTMFPTDGGAAPNLAVPTPTATAFAGGTVPVFDATKLAELSVRGNLIENTSVDTAAGGDMTFTKNVNDELVITYDNANAGTPASTFSITISDSDRVYSNSTLTFNLTNSTGDQVQLRIRLEPGTQTLNEVFRSIDYDQVSGTADTLVFTAADPATQLGTDITVGADDVEFLNLSDVNNLLDSIKIPAFFYTQDPLLNLQTVSFGTDTDGGIKAVGPSSEIIDIGKLVLATFNNPDGLVHSGGNNYRESSNSGQAATTVIGGPFNPAGRALSGTAVISGALESSNVNLANEFADLIAYQRGLQASARSVSASDEILQTLIGL